MIYTYGVTQQGAYHIKEGLVCQDAHRIVKRSDRFAIAAVADGLGSERYTDVAACIAVQVSTAHCAAHIADDDAESAVLSVMRDSFALAQRAIETAAEKNGYPLDQCDTTLSLAVLNGGVLYYGHAGDSGIVALTGDGLYVKVTGQQRDDEGRVFPLYFGEAMWTFGRFADPVASVFLATDGMYETLFPVYLKDEPVSIYVALARYFMDPDALGFAACGEAAVQSRIAAFLESIPGEQVSDDKTVVVLCDTDVRPLPQPAAYYREPDWGELKRRHDEAWNRLAYPHLYEDAERNGAEQEAQTGPCNTRD